jgi:hypothetical protein
MIGARLLKQFIGGIQHHIEFASTEEEAAANPETDKETTNRVDNPQSPNGSGTQNLGNLETSSKGNSSAC